MKFKVAARTVLELGAELISSDAIAIYELVKNAFDAGSPDVKVSVEVLFTRSTLSEIESGIAEERIETVEDAIAELKSKLRKPLTDPAAAKALAKLQVKSLAEFRRRLHEIYSTENLIQIDDTGSGMSSDDLAEAFLTIGTANRLLKPSKDKRPTLGEKGVGRLSSMRLGSKLEVRTTRSGERFWNVLNVDWSVFSSDPRRLLDQVDLSIEVGERKTNPKVSGTKLTIRDLAADWDLSKVEKLASGEFSRLVDPFLSAKEGFPIELSLNAEPVSTKRITQALFKAAHGYCKGNYMIEKSPRLKATFDYRLYSEKTDFVLTHHELGDFLGENVPKSALTSLGPFSFEFYWFNRRILKKIDEIGDRAQVKELVNAWTGGLMLYRDGFRVNPYGSKGDDWLDLNTQAFKSSGYLLNTDQILGRVQITRSGNKHLVDQTNREGLRDNFEKHALISILHNFLTKPLKVWMDGVNDEYAGLRELDLTETTEKVESYNRRVRANIKELKRTFQGEDVVVDSLQSSFNDMYVAYTKAQNYAERTEGEKDRLIELAGIGLMVEIVAHELARTTKYTLDLIRSSGGMKLPPAVRSLFQNLEAQLVTIERRLRVLDPLSVSGRQKKSDFDLVQAVRDSFEARADVLSEAGISWKVNSRAPNGRPIRVKAVKGMVVQIVENLLSNSIHWLNIAKRDRKRLQPHIEVEVRPEAGGSFVFWDNGTGVAKQFSDVIFNAFYTTRGDEGGRGLGLYIARENARHHGGDLYMTPQHAAHEGRLNAFELVLTAAS
ncbi:signal transduction histidine kinase [Bradyrhizobium sp. USDA 4501]